MKVILTIDTEGPRGNDPVLYQIWGKVGDKYYGIPEIIDICDKYGVKGLFFVDFAEAYDYGYDKILEVVQYIKKKGHDLGVHIHPHHYPNCTKHFLWEYTYNEQYKIIEDCTDLYIKMLGERPKSFRAGKYGANNDTLKIIAELGYRYDFSEYYSQKWCGISPHFAYVYPQKKWGIVEFPVTVFKSLSLGRLYHRYDKLEMTDNANEILHIVDMYSHKEGDLVVTLFAHSFSFLNYLKKSDNPTLNKKRKKCFEKVLAKLKMKKTCFICEQQLADVTLPAADSIDNIVQTRSLFKQIVYSAIRLLSIKNNRKANFLIAMITGTALAALLLIIVLFIIF